MEEQKLTDQQKSYLILLQMLDKSLEKGAFTRSDVLSYNNAAVVLEQSLFPKEAGTMEPVSEED